VAIRSSQQAQAKKRQQFRNINFTSNHKFSRGKLCAHLGRGLHDQQFSDPQAKQHCGMNQKPTDEYRLPQTATSPVF
jgi:hypothetical protein